MLDPISFSRSQALPGLQGFPGRSLGTSGKELRFVDEDRGNPANKVFPRPPQETLTLAGILISPQEK